MKRTRGWTGVIVGLGAVMALVGCSSNGKTSASSGSNSAHAASAAGSNIHIAFVCANGSVDPFFAPMVTGAKDAGKAQNVNVTYFALPPNNFNAGGLNTLLQSAINEKPQALIYCNFFGRQSDSVIQGAVNQGIPVFMDSPEPSSVKPIAEYGTANYPGGKIAGNALYAAGAKHPVCVDADPENPGFAQRCAGFAAALKAHGITGTTLNLNSNAYSNMTIYSGDLKGELAAHPSVDGLFVSSPATAAAAVQVAAQTGRSIKVATYDLSAQVVQDIKSGSITAAIWQQPYLQAYLPVVDASLYVRYGMSPIGTVNVSPVEVTKANLAKFEGAFKKGIE